MKLWKVSLTCGKQESRNLCLNNKRVDAHVNMIVPAPDTDVFLVMGATLGLEGTGGNCMKIGLPGKLKGAYPEIKCLYWPPGYPGP